MLETDPELQLPGGGKGIRTPDLLTARRIRAFRPSGPDQRIWEKYLLKAQICLSTVVHQYPLLTAVFRPRAGIARGWSNHR
jgi:hypothetical protein